MPAAKVRLAPRCAAIGSKCLLCPPEVLNSLVAKNRARIAAGKAEKRMDGVQNRKIEGFRGSWNGPTGRNTEGFICPVWEELIQDDRLHSVRHYSKSTLNHDWTHPRGGYKSQPAAGPCTLHQ